MDADRKKPHEDSNSCLCFATHVPELLSLRWMYQIYGVDQSSIMCAMSEFILLEQSRKKKGAAQLSSRISARAKKEPRSLSEPPFARIREHRQQTDHASE